jgi:hypothetical protein
MCSPQDREEDCVLAAGVWEGTKRASGWHDAPCQWQFYVVCQAGELCGLGIDQARASSRRTTFVPAYSSLGAPFADAAPAKSPPPPKTTPKVPPTAASPPPATAAARIPPVASPLKAPPPLAGERLVPVARQDPAAGSQNTDSGSSRAPTADAAAAGSSSPSNNGVVVGVSAAAGGLAAIAIGAGEEWAAPVCVPNPPLRSACLSSPGK